MSFEGRSSNLLDPVDVGSDTMSSCSEHLTKACAIKHDKRLLLELSGRKECQGTKILRVQGDAIIVYWLPLAIYKELA